MNSPLNVPIGNPLIGAGSKRAEEAPKMMGYSRDGIKEPYEKGGESAPMMIRRVRVFSLSRFTHMRHYRYTRAGK